MKGAIVRLPLLLLLLLLALPSVPICALDRSQAALGISLYNQGRLREAREVLEQVVAAGDAGAVELAVLGMSCVGLGEHDRAREVLLQAKELAPFSSLVHIGLGMLEFELGAYEPAYQHFELARQIEPDSQQAANGMVASLVNRAIQLYREGQELQAEQLLLEARRIHPDAAVVLQNLGLIEKDKGNLDRAAQYFEQALELEPRNPLLIGLLLELEKLALEKQRGGSGGNTERGGAGSGEPPGPAALIRLYRRLLEVQPDNAQAQAELGVLLNEQGQPGEAERAFLEAEALGTEEPYPYLFLARLSRERGDEGSRILSLLHSAIGKAIRKRSGLQLQAAGTIRQTEGQLGAKEMKALQRLSSLADEPRAVLLEALELLEKTHESRQAYEQDLRRLGSWYPHSPELAVALGRLLEAAGRYGQALDLWIGIVEDLPAATEAHLGLARSLEHLGRLEEARIAYLRTRDLDPENREVYPALLRLYEAAGREQDLLQHYRELYARERTNVALLDAWAELEERLGQAEQAAAHRLRARALEQREAQ
ncbi:MAG: tetratricopeptide repeat protein [Spirochaetales bacterium]|nr:tetratricopeptide repeat protein [Spirochaetales bacterium]